jgi:hypothetical protein
MKTNIIIVSSFLLAGIFAVAAPPQVTGVTAAQQGGSKLVNVSYNLVLDTDQTAFVELWFSHNNGLTYPIHCSSLEGNHGSGVSAGSKTTVWDAGTDWDGQFTSSGKIRVIATYGDLPSGYDGSGGGDGGGSGQADTSLVSVAWDVFWYSGDGNNWTDNTSGFANWFATKGGNLSNIKVDPTEVTNEKWNEVVEWANSNGYSGFPAATGDADLPMTGITLWQALKWCNARSEKEGLEPAYHVDVSELIGDHNGDGQIVNGTDTFIPWQNGDTNGVWDSGEPFTDNNSNQIFDGIEFNDLNNNNQYDAGRTQVFRQGTNIPDYGKGMDLGGSWFSYGDNCINWGANGYRLVSWDIFFKLTTGGNHKKLWPWGDETPTTYSGFSQHYTVTGIGPPVGGPSTAASVQANGYGIKHLIGNVAEWGETANESNGVAKGTVFGGSYLGLDKADGANPATFTGWGAPTTLFNLNLEGPADSSSPAVGLRCVRYAD